MKEIILLDNQIWECKKDITNLKKIKNDIELLIKGKNELLNNIESRVLSHLRDIDLRPMVESDVKVGVTIYYINDGKIISNTISEVNDPKIEYKGFWAGGNRYGYNNCYVKINTKIKN